MSGVISGGWGFVWAAYGITAAVLPIRDIPWLAKQANTLQRLAGGGFVLVAAAGFWAHDLAARGIDFATRGDEYRSRLEQLRAALDDETLGPGPAADGPQIWLAGAGPVLFMEGHMMAWKEHGLPVESSDQHE